MQAVVVERTGMSRRLIKNELLAALEKPDLKGVFRLLDSHPPHQLINILFTALCNTQELVRWHAICGFGWIIPAMADKDPESARDVMRRFLWSLNDESGGIGWGAPEAMAEIMFHCTLLRHEYLHMLVSYLREDGDEIFQDGNYLELPFLQRGLLWGIGRLCQGHRTEMVAKELLADIAAYLPSPDIQVMGLAIWCLGMLGGSFAAAKISDFLGHPGEVRLFVDNTLATVTVGKIAEDGLKQIRGAGQEGGDGNKSNRFEDKG
ncbi:MAG: HEAT repeat domain-containing protein [Pseudomonadota bacterium]